MKYKIGEKVVVKNNLSDLEPYYMLREDGTQNLNVGDCYVGEMKNFAGKTVTIKEYRAGRYVVEELENLLTARDRVLPKVIGVYLSAEEHKELLEYKHMYENLCK